MADELSERLDNFQDWRPTRIWYSIGEATAVLELRAAQPARSVMITFHRVLHASAFSDVYFDLDDLLISDIREHSELPADLQALLETWGPFDEFRPPHPLGPDYRASTVAVDRRSPTPLRTFTVDAGTLHMIIVCQSCQITDVG